MHKMTIAFDNSTIPDIEVPHISDSNNDRLVSNLLNALTPPVDGVLQLTDGRGKVYLIPAKMIERSLITIEREDGND